MKRGFSLVEMIFVSLLLSLIFATAFGLFASVIRGQSSQIAIAVLYNTAALVDQSLTNACDGASFIEVPPIPIGSLAGTLRVWAGVKPADWTPIAGQTPGFSYFCGDAGGNLWLYQGPSARAAPNPVSMPPIACGANPPAKVTRTELVGGAMRIIATNVTFTRTATNQINAYYRLTMPPKPGRTQPPIVTHQTVLAAQEGSL